MSMHSQLKPAYAINCAVKPLGITHQAPKEGRLWLANVDRVSTSGRESSASTPPLGQRAQHDPAEEREDARDEERDTPRCGRDHVREADRRDGASDPEHRLLEAECGPRCVAAGDLRRGGEREPVPR